MARPIPDVRYTEIARDKVDKKSKDFETTVYKIVTSKNSQKLVFGTVSGWFTGLAVVKVGKIAAFGLGGGVILLHFASEWGYISVNWERVREATDHSRALLDTLLVFMKARLNNTTAPGKDQEKPNAPDPVVQQAIEPYKCNEEPTFLDKTFIPPKPLPHSPKISPSSIPNPNPSVTTNKPLESGYPNYGGYLYSIPGYSAFQPVSYPGMITQNQVSTQSEAPAKDLIPYSAITAKESTEKQPEKPAAKIVVENQCIKENPDIIDVDEHKPQTDFEEQFTPEIITTTPISEVNKPLIESKMSISSLSQGSGATVTISTQIANKEPTKKPMERFSLKTSIPISKIDMKCVTNPPDNAFQNTLTKNSPISFNPSFQNTKVDPNQRIEIQSNIVIKTAGNDVELNVENTKGVVLNKNINNNLSILSSNSETAAKIENKIWRPECKTDLPKETSKDATTFTAQISNVVSKPIYNPATVEPNKVYPIKPTDGVFSEQKNQILFIQNKNNFNPKMLLTIQQQNPQVLLQRTNIESKNLQAPSRLSAQSKKCKEELMNENGTLSKVVALKRLHQDNCDENDFENLITENQIYGNKIVVKEKSQGTQQEQDLKNKAKADKTQSEGKNVVLQPNFLYLSNVQFPANLMMIKNNSKVSQPLNDLGKGKSNENKVTNESSTMTNNNDSSKLKTQTVGKEIHILKSNNNVLQTLSNKNKKDIVLQTGNQKVIMNSQIVYQVPMIVDSDNKLNQPFINRDKQSVGQKNDSSKQFEDVKTNEKLFIACPYQMDSKLQPKIVITNIRPKISKVEEISSLDIYEKKRRLRRMKYLINREAKDDKSDRKKDKTEKLHYIISPAKMSNEIYKEFAATKILTSDYNSGSDSEYGEEELKEYKSIIKEYGNVSLKDDGKIEFLANFRLATQDTYKEKQLEKQERILKTDSVAAAYISAGRIDRLTYENMPDKETSNSKENLVPIIMNMKSSDLNEKENRITLQKKQLFLAQLKLTQISPRTREGYEKIWQEILKERKRRYGANEEENAVKKPKQENAIINSNDQLKIMTEIKKCVNENNNLIKRRLDSNSCTSLNDGESIHILAEKNFSELNRLSKMADRSVKLLSGKDIRKRDVNPGFDSENIKKMAQLVHEQPQYLSINIPNVSKIISLKSTLESAPMSSSQATSMDEPRNSAAGVKEMFSEEENLSKNDFSCQVDEVKPSWPGLEAILKSYREFDAARKKEIVELQRRNTALRVECAHTTRAASRDSDKAHALLSERQNLASEENRVRMSLQKLCTAIDVVRKYL